MNMNHYDEAQPVEATKRGIWRLFVNGYMDEDTATATLLALDLDARRGAHQKGTQQDVGRAWESAANAA